MEKPLVSICIPTYNRHKQLKITLDSIVCQPELIDGRVEIIISDNASDDKTNEIGLEYSSRYKNVYYYRNSENIRDKNFPLALSRANGVLRKLNNDTFCIAKEGLKKLCLVAKKYKDKRPQIFLANGRKKLGIDKTVSCRDFIVEEGFWVTWIASFTIWEDDCSGIENDTAGCELSLWQVKKLYELAYRKDAVVICDKTIGMSMAIPKKNLSYGLYQVFYSNYLSLLKPYLEANVIDEIDFNNIEKKLFFDFFIQWIINWELDKDNFVYSEGENLKEAVFSKCKERIYWRAFQNTYRKRYLIETIKRFIKGLVHGNKNQYRE